MNAHTAVLLRTWGVLTALTLATMLLGKAGHGAIPDAIPGIAGAAAMMAITMVKGRQILTHYVGLHGPGNRWRPVLTGYLLVLGIAILGAYAAGLLR